MNSESTQPNSVSEYAYKHSAVVTFDDLSTGLCHPVPANPSRDNILSRMDKLRTLAKQQGRGRAAKSDKVQTSFCF